MNTLFINARNNNNNNGIVELIPILTFPIVAAFMMYRFIQLFIKLSQILSQIFSEEIVLHIIAALIAAEIVYILTLVMEQAFNKVDRAITKLKEDNKEKEKVIIKLLQSEQGANTKTKDL
jgi:hypothetical protein